MGNSKAALLALGIIFTLSSCGGGGGGGGSPPVTVAPTPPTPPAPPPTPPPPPPPTTASVERDINPLLTNPALTDNLSAHFAINPATGSARNRLFLMLPGTTAIPALLSPDRQGGRGARVSQHRPSPTLMTTPSARFARASIPRRLCGRGAPRRLSLEVIPARSSSSASKIRSPAD